MSTHVLDKQIDKTLRDEGLNLSRQRVYGIRINRFYNEFFWFQVQEKLHIGWERKQLTISANIIIAILNNMLNLVLVRMIHHSFYIFCLGALSLNIQP